MSTNFHHVGIVVENLTSAITKYSQALGLDSNNIIIHQTNYITGKGETEEFDYAFIPLGNNTFLELVSPLTEGPTKRYLEKKGEGLFHLALESENIQETIKNFDQAGMPLAGRTPTEKVLSVFLHPKSSHGVLIQLMKKNLLLPDGSPNLEVALSDD